MKNRIVKFTAKVMICVMVCQLVLPATHVFALTTGPSQPEVQSFEPVGTTDMVDLFSGDFVYNIPLMDVDGYPINISYHSGINMEQEASWVGLGWNINPGEINRAVRGVPDDFDADTISKFLHMKPENDYRLRLGVNAGMEIAGAASVGINAGTFVSYNNYKGMGVGYDVSASLSTPVASTGLGVSVGSLDGATINENAGLTYSTSMTEAGNTGSISFSGSTGFNTRTGLNNISFNLSAQNTKNAPPKIFSDGNNDGGIGFGSSIPIGTQNYVAVVTNATNMSAYSFQLKFGIEAMFTFPHFNTTLTKSSLSYAPNGSLPAFGYLFSQDAGKNGIMDFSREKDGVYNSSLPNLPLSSMTYDIYAVSGQGTGGTFRPHRSDIGTVSDPLVTSTTNNDNLDLEVGVGIGAVGGLFELGTDATIYKEKVESGSWFTQLFKQNKSKSLFENTYFKQGGEMTYSLQQDAAAIASHNPVYATLDGQLKKSDGSTAGSLPTTYSEVENRSPRANLLTFFTNGDANHPNQVTSTKLIENYPVKNFINNNAAIQTRQRTGSRKNHAKTHQIAEMTQTLPDGRRFIYGLPAMNNYQKDVTFSVDPNNRNIGTGLVKFSTADDYLYNTQGRENFYQATYTPAYAHSYLLTQVLSPDYVDIDGDGLSEDDLGTYTKFNYSMTDSDYRWIAPIQAMEGSDSAQYNPGFWSDTRDDKGNYTIGSREMWYMHSIETKNSIAEFYISPRKDGRGVLRKIVSDQEYNVDHALQGNKSTSSPSVSYKLDSIKLYNKHDRFVNQANAVPIKTVIFTYNYSLCPGVPNRAGTTEDGTGKLTLQRIYFRYGNSDRSLLNPYVFTYNSDHNPAYNFGSKDRWGNFKTSDASITNYEFPYVKQDKADADSNAANWSLTQIKLPSGGRLKIQMEADDYSSIQDRQPMEMFKVAGVGSSTTFDPKDVLYENEDRPYDYIYFKRDKAREVPGKTMQYNYLANSSLMYFSFNLDISAKNRFEHIKGYAKVIDVGISSNNDYGYIKVKRETAGDNGKEFNPVTLAGLNIGRYYLPQIIYPGYNDGDEGGMGDVLNGLIAATSELLTVFQDANVRFIKQGLAKKFIVNKSWIRLNTPGFTKIGGGSRVKQLTIEDSWDQMATNGHEAVYGKTYDYTTLKDNNLKVSSGVASYEPSIGNDENPFHRPVDYTASSGKLLPPIQMYQEEPFGESFFPEATVGYSKVTVRSINKDISASAKAEDVYEFYTAKDFPVETSYTPKNIPVDSKHRTLTQNQQELQVLQGYMIKLNDMHGKPKAISNYVIKPDNVNRELITSTRYNYQVDAQGKLNNVVKAVKRDHLVKPSYSVANTTLGEEVDFTVDSRRREMESNSTTIAFNLNVVNFAFISIPLPTVFFPDMYEHSQFETMVATKIVQQYGILKSVDISDHGAKVTTENELYDSETGQVLLSKVNNEFDDPVHKLLYPAYWAYDNMGPSYYNVGFEDDVDSAVLDNCGRLQLIGISNKRHYNYGDELLLQFNAEPNTDKREFKVWVYGVGSSTSQAGTSCGVSTITDPCTIVVEPDKQDPTGDAGFPWLLNVPALHKVHIKVLRSGRRNLLNSTVQDVTINGAYTVNTFADLFNAPQFGNFAASQSTLLSASVNTYKDAAVNKEFGVSGVENMYKYNGYLKGEKGNWREWCSYLWKGSRNYPNNARTDGMFLTFNPFWQLGTAAADSSDCSLLDYIISPTSQLGWQKTKEVTVYNSYGNVVEEQDAAHIPSTALYGFNFTMPLAVAANAKQGQVKYIGFEDLLQIQNYEKVKIGINPSMIFLIPFYSGNSYNYIYNYGKKYVAPQPTDYVVGSSILPGGHTGKYALYTNNASNIQVAAVSDYAGVTYAYVSFWVKRQNGTVPDISSIIIQATNPSAGTHQNYNAFAIKTGSIDGWYKLEGKIAISPMNAYTYININMPASYFIDDIRMSPDGSNMKSFAYDMFTNRLMAELDENNYATYYEYNEEGALLRIKKESERGILTVSETRKSNAKTIQ